MIKVLVVEGHPTIEGIVRSPNDKVSVDFPPLVGIIKENTRVDPKDGNRYACVGTVKYMIIEDDSDVNAKKDAVKAAKKEAEREATSPPEVKTDEDDEESGESVEVDMDKVRAMPLNDLRAFVLETLRLGKINDKPTSKASKAEIIAFIEANFSEEEE